MGDRIWSGLAQPLSVDPFMVVHMFIRLFQILHLYIHSRTSVFRTSSVLPSA